MATGTIEADEFEKAIMVFMDISNAMRDTWQIHQPEEGLTGMYLCKRQTVGLDLKDESCQTAFSCVNNCEESEVEVDTDELESSSPLVPCNFEYHIIYSPSYGVPVLYFNAYKPDGCLLTLEELWNSIPAHYQHRLHHEKWTFITQQEHPLLGRPYFQLHPCHTCDLMTQVTKEGTLSSSKYLVSWLSSVGPVVHLHLPLAYANPSKPD